MVCAALVKSFGRGLHAPRRTGRPRPPRGDEADPYRGHHHDLVHAGGRAINAGAELIEDYGILSPLTIGGTAVVLHIFTEDVERAWQRAVDAGAEVLVPLQEPFWGDRQRQLLDPFGHKWGLAQHVREVPPEEIAAAAAAMFAPEDPASAS
jgi:uncharacterized glyoxalase superfamily protein PhnB